MYRGTTSCEIGVNGQQTDDWTLDGQIAGKKHNALKSHCLNVGRSIKQ